MADKDKLHLLLIDDQPHDRALARLVLGQDLPDARIQEIVDAAEFAAALRKGRFDLVITDIQLSWTDGLAIFRSIRETRPEVPVVALTELRDEELVVEAMKAGFADFVFKGSRGYLELPGAVQSAWEKARNRLLAARSEPWLGTLLERSDVGVYRSTLDGRLIEATPAVLRLLGVTSIQEALEISLPRPRFLSEEKEDLLARLTSDRTLRSREVELARADGSTVWLNLTELLLLDVDEEMVIDVLVQDVTHLKEREAKLQHRLEDLERSNADLSQFAYMASHELQEPLRMVEKFGAILAEDYRRKLGAQGGEILQSVLGSVHRMQGLIDDLLALSRIDSEGEAFEEVDCSEVVEDAIFNLEDAIEDSGAEIERQELPTVLGDNFQLVQLWQNLLSNAIKFRREEAPRVKVSVEEREQEWIFAVEDNGIGIDPKELENIFTIFRRLHPELPGTGIGLTICQRIVERHGGRLWAESQAGKGSRFLFSLPKGDSGASEENET